MAEAAGPGQFPVARFAPGPRIREWAAEHRFSDWMVARLVRLTDQPSLLLDGLRRKPPRYVRVNPLRGHMDEVKKRLEARGFQMSHADLDPAILRLRQSPISAGATVEHLLGMTTLQDLASASAPLALAARPGEVIADLAAAPGVKTMHMAGDLGGRGAIVAVEPNAERMRALRFNLERCGVTTAVLRRHEAQQLPGAGWADKVLLDAPCSGEGTIPNDRNRRFARPEDITTYAGLQAELLDAADRVLRPGGTLVYATCTFAPEENEAQLQRMVERGYTMESLPFDRCGGVPLAPGVTEWPGYRLDGSLAKARRFLPGIHPTLGFFVARLRKPDAPASPPGPGHVPRPDPAQEAKT
ncbi:MAG TPA: RsmB/NOP family class I SAM-dependent RNA methyltransferase [Candidatus Thermoplasmatota archaeon]|nr:RsmB/NOP family class I SAM-dependent RNA methyltransferase [Candidatus Thermoplasmatota archaeon]